MNAIGNEETSESLKYNLERESDDDVFRIRNHLKAQHNEYTINLLKVSNQNKKVTWKNLPIYTPVFSFEKEKERNRDHLRSILNKPNKRTYVILLLFHVRA